MMISNLYTVNNSLGACGPLLLWVKPQITFTSFITFNVTNEDIKESKIKWRLKQKCIFKTLKAMDIELR